LKILILKPSSLGDVVQALPVLRLIKKHLPNSEIHWWIESRLAPLLAGDPDLAGLVLFDRQRWASPQNWGEVFHSVRWMREQRFDWVIDLQCLFRSGAFAWFANGALTVGLDEPREGARAFYDLTARRHSFHTHAVDWYLGTLPLLGVPVHWDFNWLPERQEVAAAVRSKASATGARWMIIQPGARWVNKPWPIEHFTALVGRLAASNPEFHFAALGGPEDRPLGEIIARVDPRRCLDLTGKLSLLEMVEWIRFGELMVTNDTGPMHVAAALGKPVVALFGPTEPRRTGPYGQLHHTLQLNLPCVPCMKSSCGYAKPFECLRALTPGAVFDAVQAQIQGVSAGKSWPSIEQVGLPPTEPRL
jgi:lipopolysaccharide heptosyltransferase II